MTRDENSKEAMETYIKTLERFSESLTAERDEARKLAKQMAAFAVAVAPLHAHRCIFCDGIGRYSTRTGSYAEIGHSPYCPVLTIKRWEENNE